MEPVPVHGFVLAGGTSSRMGQDKALLEFCGRPMIALAVETLRAVCAEVAISGNRDDLARWATVVHESRAGAGPAAGIEAALQAAKHGWVLMLPVDLPLMSAELLQGWVRAVLARDDVRASYLHCEGEPHPALCLVHQECVTAFQEALDANDRKLTRIFARLGGRLLVLDAATLMPDAARCFANVNTPQELAAAERMQYLG